jgi:cation transport ATPase
VKHDPHQGYVGPHQHEQQLNRNLPNPNQSSHDRHSSHEHAGHDKHAGHSPAMFQRRSLVCLLLTLPVLYLSLMFQMWFNYQAIQFAGVDWVTPILSTIIYWYGGWVFLRGAWSELHSKIGMMTLVALAITVSYVYSLAVSFGLPGDSFYMELVTLVDIMLLGHWIEMTSVQGASRALEHLAKLVPTIAHQQVNGRIEDVQVSALAEGDRILIRPGEQVPIDEEVIEGTSSVLVTINATAMAAKNGILVRNREAFERARGIKTIAFDKTGTITEGKFGVKEIYTDGIDEAQALTIAASLESLSEHPLGQSIVVEANHRHSQLVKATEFKAVPGQGVEGVVNDRRYRIGRPEWVQELKLQFPPGLRSDLQASEARGESAIVLMNDKQVLAIFGLADQIRPSARAAVAKLQQMGVQVVMITGDAEAVAKTVADDLKIDRYYARVLPQDKAALIHRLKAEQPIAFVGDGINDAPALTEADLGLAIGAGTNVAIESADLVLIKSDPLDATYALKLAKATYSKMTQNLFWATGYNVIGIPLAAGVAAPLGIILTPANAQAHPLRVVGAILMSVSTVVVSINAMLLRRIKLTN